MMADQKQQQLLHELLKEDQEPFLLKNYIADRKCQLKRALPKTQLHVKKHKPSQNFCKNACFFSFNSTTYSPDPRKSPLFQSLHSPASKSPCKSPNTIFLHIPARTAALLLEASLRIQKQSTTPKTKNNGSGLFGSLLKRITNRNKTRKLENNVEKKIKKVALEEEVISRIGRDSSAVWSESINGEEKSLDLETSSSSCHESEEDLVAREFVSFDQQHFCDSPFHFVLRRSPSTGHRTPEFRLSPISSPTTTHHHHQFQGKENNEVESLKKLQVEEEEEEEEDKEQCSPVSVLDPPFVDDDDGHDDPCEDDGFDLECSYAIVQKAKQQLLAKLRRFEKLAELDPVELEKRILEQETDDDDDDSDYVDETNNVDDQLVSSHIEVINNMIIEELSSKPRLYGLSKVPKDMKRLVSDLINEEQKDQNCIADEEEAIVKSVCKRLETWKEVESNTIDMMVEQDFKKEHNGWKENQENVRETAVEIELAIFGLLVEELSEELIGFNRCD